VRPQEREHIRIELPVKSDRRPQLNRNLDRDKAIGGKEDGERINDDGGLDPRVNAQRASSKTRHLKTKKCRTTKKEQDKSPALKIVSTLFPRKFRFDLDGRGDAACARQGSSRDLDHQTSTLRSA
jgi:hypothetical protein